MPPTSSSKTSQPVSVRRLAELAGVSRSTVSRAFRDGASISPELRARILDEAERRGYRPDPLVSELMSSFAKRRPVNYRETLGVLWWPERWAEAGVQGTFAWRVRAGLEVAATKHGCRLTQFVLERATVTGLGRTLAARRIQGIVMTPPSAPEQAAPALDWASLSVVAIGRSLSTPSFNCVHHHHYAALVQVLKRLKERGFRRPVLLVETGLEERMQRAYTAAFLAHEAGTPEQVLRLEARTPALLARRLRGLEPDVIIADTTSWLEAIRGLPAAARRTGLVVLDVAQRDGAVSGVYQNVERMAECAVDLLMQGRLHNETGIPAEAINMLTPGLWVEGATLSTGVRSLDQDAAAGS